MMTLSVGKWKKKPSITTPKRMAIKAYVANLTGKLGNKSSVLFLKYTNREQTTNANAKILRVVVTTVGSLIAPSLSNKRELTAHYLNI